MYTFTKDLDLSFLIGKEITLVSIYQFHISLNFSDDGQISVENSFEIVDGQDKFVWSQGAVNLNLPSGRLFGTKVLSYIVENEQTLNIVFDNGLLIRFFDSEQYESLQISDQKGKVYII